MLSESFNQFKIDSTRFQQAFNIYLHPKLKKPSALTFVNTANS